MRHAAVKTNSLWRGCNFKIYLRYQYRASKWADSYTDKKLDKKFNFLSLKIQPVFSVTNVKLKIGADRCVLQSLKLGYH